MATATIHSPNTAIGRRDLQLAIDVELAAMYDCTNRVEDRYCPACDSTFDRVVIDDGVVESAECVECGFVHDWAV